MHTLLLTKTSGGINNLVSTAHYFFVVFIIHHLYAFGKRFCKTFSFNHLTSVSLFDRMTKWSPKVVILIVKQ